MYARTLYVGWGDLDANGHMRNTAYLDLAADVRFAYFAEHGFAPGEFARLAIGPVVRSDTVEYLRELHLLDEVRVTLTLAALSADAARFVVRNEFYRGERLAARVTSTGGWLDQRRRALVPPPAALAAAMRAIPRAAEFSELPTPASD